MSQSISYNQRSGDNCINIQIVNDISVKLLLSIFRELSPKTKKKIENNQQAFINTLASKLLIKIPQKTIDDPDFQYTIKQALISAGKSSSEELHERLALLIIERINNDNDGCTKIIYNEAIKTINKLTKDQLKIITLCFVLQRTQINVKSWKEYAEKYIEPFLDFENTTINFLHLDYVRCISIDRVGRWDAVNTLIKYFPNLGPNEIKEEIQKSDIGENFLDLLKNSLIQHLELTSVGIVIAMTYFKQITGNKLDIDFFNKIATYKSSPRSR